MQVNAMAVGADGAVYVANDAGLYRTDDQGASWVDLQLGIPVAAVAVDPVSAAVFVGPSNGFSGVFTSTDAGQTCCPGCSACSIPEVDSRCGLSFITDSPRSESA